jgi:hypothetical protein
MALSTLTRPAARPTFQRNSLLPRQAQRQPLAEVKPMPRLQTTDRIDAMRGYYLVSLAGNSMARHIVRKDRVCVEHGPACPAVEAVAVYLRAGGERAADLPADQLIPSVCPVCGGPVKFEPRLCSPSRGAGWICLEAARQSRNSPAGFLPIPGEAHYWAHAWESVRSYMQRGVAR